MALRMSVDMNAPSDRVLMLAAEVVQAGGVVVYPTDTLYGLGSNAWNSAAVRRVHAVKRMPEEKPVLVIVGAPASVPGLTDEITECAASLMASCWPGPLTLLFRAAPHVPAAVTGGSGKIGIRIPANLFCRRLCELSGSPITSTSANISGEPAGESIPEIESALGGGIDLFIDGGVLPRAFPSTVVDVSESVPRLLREGVIAFEALVRIVPTIVR